jgi:hypothetical protein
MANMTPAERIKFSRWMEANSKTLFAMQPTAGDGCKMAIRDLGFNVTISYWKSCKASLHEITEDSRWLWGQGSRGGNQSNRRMATILYALAVHARKMTAILAETKALPGAALDPILTEFIDGYENSTEEDEDEAEAEVA